MSLLVLVNNESDLNMIGECFVRYQIIICEYYAYMLLYGYHQFIFV